MDLTGIDILKFGIFDLIDIVLVAFIVYQIYNLIRGTIAVNILIGLLSIYLLWWLVRALDMKLMTGILNNVIGVGVIALIVVFQQEIRRFLLIIGKNTIANRKSFWSRFFPKSISIESDESANFRSVLEACKNLSADKTGALIIFARTYEEQIFTNNGEVLNAKISKRLLESIFNKLSPLHDGAVVIAENRIKVASCILPLTENEDLPAQMGLRHRAAIGISEQSDSVAVVVSEETGTISFASRGKVRYDITIPELEKLLVRNSMN